MAVRDRIAIGVIAAGALLALACWHTSARWASAVVLVVAVVAASVVYRMRTPRDLPPSDEAETFPDRAGRVGSDQ